MTVDQLDLYRVNGHQVSAWRDYGIVAPSLWTTNGSIDYVAGLTSQHVQANPDCVTDSRLPKETDFSDQATLLRALHLAYAQFCTGSKP